MVKCPTLDLRILSLSAKLGFMQGMEPTLKKKKLTEIRVSVCVRQREKEKRGNQGNQEVGEREREGKRERTNN